MPELMNFQTGQIENLDGADYTQAILSKRYGVREGDTIAAVTPQGEYRRIPATEAATAFQHGWLHESDAAEQRRKAEEKYGSAGQSVLAGLAGAARGASLGLSDVALTKSGLVEPETLKGLQDANPTASTLGEIGGAGIGLLAPGGALVRGAGTAAKAAGLATLGGEGLLATVGRKAVGSAVEGALYGGGQLLTEDALGETPFTAEALLSHVGAGALLGGAAGGAFGLAPKAIKAVSQATSDALDRVLPGATTREKIGNFLQDYADSGAVEATGATAKDYGKLRRMGISKREMAKEMFDSGIVSHDIGEIVEKSAAIKEETGQAIGDTVKKLESFAEANPEKVPFKERLSTGSMADKIQSEVLEPLKSEVAAGNAPIIARVEQEIANLRAANSGKWAGQLPLSEGETIKRSYDKFLKPGAEPTPMQDALRGIRRIIKESVEGEAERIAQKADPQLAKDYMAAKRKYQIFSEINKMAQAKMDRVANAPTFGLKDYGAANMFGMAAAAMHPGAALAGLPVALAHKLIRERGPTFSAALANKAARLAKMERAVNATKNEIESSVTAMLTPSRAKQLTSALPAPAAVFGGFSLGKGQSMQPSMADHIEPPMPDKKQRQFDEQFARLSVDPQALQDRITASLEHIGDVAPKASMGMAVAAAKVVNFVQSKAPKNPNPITGIKALGAPAWQPTDTEVYRYARYADAALNPMNVIKGLGTGAATPEGIETLKTLYPALFQQTVQSITEQLSDPKAPSLDYDTRIRLSALLGTPLDPMARPANIKALQASYAQADTAFGPSWKPAQVAQSNMNLSNGTETMSQKLEGKNA